jgi:hypothetical protein
MKINYISVNVYLRPKQRLRLLELKKNIFEEYNLRISVTELVRDATDIFIENTSEKGLKFYLESKGW